MKRPAAAMKGREPTWQSINHLGQTWAEFVDHLKEEYKDYKAREESFKTRDPKTGRLDFLTSLLNNNTLIQPVSKVSYDEESELFIKAKAQPYGKHFRIRSSKALGVSSF